MSGPTPTIAQVRSWQPLTLFAAGRAIDSGGEALSDRMAEVDLAVDKIAHDWKGDAAAAASMRAVSELLSSSQTRRAAATIRTAIDTHGGTINGHRTALLNAVDLIHLGFPSATIWSDGTVTVPPMHTGPPTTTAVAVAHQKLVNAAEDHTKTLKEHLNTIGTALNALKFAVALGLTDLELHGGPGGSSGARAGLSGAGGQTLGTKVREAVDAGKDIPDEVLEQIINDLKAAGTPPDQIDAYLRGEEVTVPASTQQYLQQFMNAAGADGFTATSQQLQAQGPAGQQAAASLANGAFMLSNEKVGSGRGPNNELLNAGKYENLPPDMRELLSTRAAPTGWGTDPNATTYPGDHDFYSQNAAEYITKQSELLEALSLGEPGNEPGTKMSTEVLRQGLHLAELDSSKMPDGIPGNVPIDNAIDNAIDVGSRNDDGKHAIFTGEGGPDVLGDGYKHDQAPLALLQRDTGPDSADSPIADLTDWIHRDAIVTAAPGDPDYQQQVQDATRAGEAANGLASTIASDKNSLGVNVNEVLLKDPGKISAGAAQQAAEALSPYVDRMAGVPDVDTPNRGFADLNGPVESLRVFSVLNTDEQAAATINGAALAESLRIDSEYAIREATTNGDADESLSWRPARRLEWLVDNAIDIEYGSREDAAISAAENKTDRFASAYTALQVGLAGGGPLGLSTAVAMEPGKLVLPEFQPESVGRHSPLTLDSMGGGLANTPHGSGDTGAFNNTQWGTQEHRRYMMLQTLANEGIVNFDDVPDIYKDESGTRFKPYFEFNSASTDIPAEELGPARSKVENLLTSAGLHNDTLNGYLDNASSGESELNELVPNVPKDASKHIPTPAAAEDPDNEWPVR